MGHPCSESYSDFTFTQFYRSGGCEVTLWGALVGTMGLCLLKRLPKHTAAQWEHAGGSLHTSNGQQPDLLCATERKNNSCTLTIALAGAEFYPVKHNLHRHCKLSLPVSPSRHKTLISSVECAKYGKKRQCCLT